MKRLAAVLVVAAGLAGAVPATANAAPRLSDSLVCSVVKAGPLDALGLKMVPYCE